MMLIPALLMVVVLVIWNLKTDERISARITFTVPGSLPGSVQSPSVPVAGYILLPAALGKKVTIHQPVEIRLEHSPKQKPVNLEGTVHKITWMDSAKGISSHYFIEVTLKEDLVSKFREFPFPSAEPVGNAEIITGQQRFLTLLLDPLLSPTL